MLAGDGRVALMACQHAEVPLKAADLALVAPRGGESQPAGVPRLGARPLALGERRVTQSLARRDSAWLVELCFRDRQRPLEVRSEEHTSELQSHVNLVCR